MITPLCTLQHSILFLLSHFNKGKVTSFLKCILQHYSLYSWSILHNMVDTHIYHPLYKYLSVVIQEHARESGGICPSVNLIFCSKWVNSGKMNCLFTHKTIRTGLNTGRNLPTEMDKYHMIQDLTLDMIIYVDVPAKQVHHCFRQALNRCFVLSVRRLTTDCQACHQASVKQHKASVKRHKA